MVSHSTVVLLLRFAGIGLLIGAVVWLFTGDIDSPYLSLHVTGGCGGSSWLLPARRRRLSVHST